MIDTNIRFKNKSKIPIKLFYLLSISKNKKQDYDIRLCENDEKYIILNKDIIEKTFSELLFEYIDKYNIDEISLYKKAGIDRRLFSKIKSDKDYHPSLGTISLLALAMNLSTNDYIKLLNSASYSLPQNSYINITLKYCFDEKIFDVSKANELLYNISHKTIKELW